MLGYESERRLIELLLTVKDGEQRIESARQRLCLDRDFAPYSAFQRIDRDANEFITAYEIQNFLRDNREYSFSLRECEKLVKFFDSDEDGRLSFLEYLFLFYFPSFTQIFLPCEDNYLRAQTQDRYAYRVGRFDYLRASLEYSISDILSQELRLMSKVEMARDSVMRRYDYSVYAAFRSIDKYNDGFVDAVSLGSFLRSHYHYLLEKELLCIVRRLDTDGDARISYSEFSDFLRSEYVVERPIQAELKPRHMSEQKARRPQSSPLRGTNNARSKNMTSPGKKQINFDSYERTPEKK